MASENTIQCRGQDLRITSENTQAALVEYRAALSATPLSAQTVRTYLSKVRGYLTWLVDTDVIGDPLTERRAQDWAVRDYRAQLLTIAKRSPATINNTLAALDDFYTRRGLDPASADRLDLPAQALRALDRKAALRWLRAIQDHPSPRDRVLALLPFYAGLCIGEAEHLRDNSWRHRPRPRRGSAWPCPPRNRPRLHPSHCRRPRQALNVLPTDR